MENFIMLLYESRECLLDHSRFRFQLYKCKEKVLHSSLGSLQRLQEHIPDCEWIEALLTKARADLEECEQKESRLAIF